MPSPPGSSSLVGRTCLVTGASGFLGQCVVKRLVDAGMAVTAQLRISVSTAPGVEQRLGDISEPGWSEATREQWRWDSVVHLAGPVAAGATGFVEEARAARAHAVIALSLARAIPPGWRGRLVHASSMTVYGAAVSLPVKETQSLAPSFLYALGKVLAEDVWRAARLPDWWLLRLPGLFSAERRSGALYHFIKAGLAGAPIELTAREPTLWDVLHVDDAAEAIVRVLSSPAPFGGALNVSYGEVVSLERVARMISALTTGTEVNNPSKLLHPDFQLDISRASELLTWPPSSLKSRIVELIDQTRRQHA